MARSRYRQEVRADNLAFAVLLVRLYLREPRPPLRSTPLVYARMHEVGMVYHFLNAWLMLHPLGSFHELPL